MSSGKWECVYCGWGASLLYLPQHLTLDHGFRRLDDQAKSYTCPLCNKRVAIDLPVQSYLRVGQHLVRDCPEYRALMVMREMAGTVPPYEP